MIRTASIAGLLLVGATALAAGPAARAQSCRRSDETAAPSLRGAPCRGTERLEPYDPERLKAGRPPGFIDLGNGTEVRVGGRVRLDVDTRR